MKYKEAIKKSMEMLAQKENIIFLGYNICFGSQAYGTLIDIPNYKKIETPLAENLMAGLAMGMALEGYDPVLFFERHDFLLNALDNIVNHLSKLEEMSKDQFHAPVIIRAVVGSKSPLYPGVQHIQDFTKPIQEMVSFPVIDLRKTEEIIPAYEKARDMKTPIMIVERRDLYDKE
jgi:pyruvate/2-oxoglutarate/acetoin dehydrogenase E1 component